MNKIKVALLALAVAIGLTFWLAPKIVYNSVTQALADHSWQLSCLDWRVSGWNRISIDEFCTKQEGISLSARSIHIKLDYYAYLANRFNAQHLVADVNIEQITATAVTVASLSSLNQGSSRDSSSNIQLGKLPNVAINRLQVELSELETSPFAQGFGLRFTQNGENNVVWVNALGHESHFAASSRLEGNQAVIDWRLDLPWITKQLLLLPGLPSQWQQFLQIGAGSLLGELSFDLRQPKQLTAQLTLQNMVAELQLPSLGTHPLQVKGDDMAWRLGLADGRLVAQSDAKNQVSLHNLATALAPYLAQSNIAGWQPTAPTPDIAYLDLPSKLNFDISSKTLTSTAITFAMAGQKVSTQEISVDIANTKLETALTGTHQLALVNEFKDTIAAGFSWQAGLSLATDKAQLSVAKLKMESTKLSQIAPASANISWSQTELTAVADVTLDGSSPQIQGNYQLHLADMQIPNITLGTVTSEGNFDLNANQLSSEHVISLNDGLVANMSTQGTLNNQKIIAELPETQLSELARLMNSLPDALAITGGSVQGNISTQLHNNGFGEAQVRAHLSGASASYQDYLLKDASTELKLAVSSDGTVNAEPSVLQIAEIFTGLPLQNIKASYQLAGNLASPEIQVQDLSGKLLQGSFLIPNLHYPLDQDQSFTLNLEALSLNDLVTIHGQEGIDISGTISGDIPVSFSGGSASVSNASFNADAPGTLKIKDNVAFINLKNSQESLAPALSLLENLDYTKLAGQADLRADGWLDIAVAIEGMNPEQEQPVVFNPTFSTNLYTTLKALRAGQVVTETLQKELENRR